MKTFADTLLALLALSVFQNAVLSTGLGSSSMLRLLRRPRQFLPFCGLLAFFSVLTTAIFYPIDRVLPADRWEMRLLRPFFILCIVSVLYLIFFLTSARLFPRWFKRNHRLIPLAAFNNLSVGIVLILNYQVSLPFFPALGVAAGASLGFLLLCAVTAEGVSRLDNPDIPASFRGLPATLLYLGLLALALMGFTPVYNLL